MSSSLSCFSLALVTIAYILSSWALPAVAQPAGWAYVGCFVDGLNGRALPTLGYSGLNNTVENCISTCAGLGFRIAGMEYSSVRSAFVIRVTKWEDMRFVPYLRFGPTPQECWCSELNPTAVAASTDCDLTCSGNATEICGAGNRLSVYQNLTSAPPAPAPPAGWSYLDCIIDTGTPRTLPYGAALPSSATINECTTACLAAGYNVAGAEYSTVRPLRVFCLKCNIPTR
jgi:hypothetical protein